jgi:hypothetical protein
MSYVYMGIATMLILILVLLVGGWIWKGYP